MTKGKVYQILLMVLLYLYIYNPIPVWPGFGFVVVLMLVALGYAALRYKTVLGYLKYYKAELFLTLFMLVYVPAICIINRQSPVSAISDLVKWFWCTVLVPIFLLEVVISRCNRAKKPIYFLDLVLNVGILAATITLLCVLVPPFNSLIRGLQSFKEYEMVSDLAEAQSSYRFFGLASNLVSGYGFVQGVLAALCLLRLNKQQPVRKREQEKDKDKEKRSLRVNKMRLIYAVAFVVLLISVIVNARTGLFPIFFALILLLLRSLKKRDVRTLTRIAVGTVVVVGALVVLLKRFPDISAFVLDFFLQMSGLVGDTGLEGTAYGTMLMFPDTLTGLVFGEGHSIFLEEMGSRSDIAYVNQIFTGGLVYVAALLVYEFVVYRKVCKRSGSLLFPTVVLLSLLVFNYKGTPFTATNAVVKLWMLYYFVLVYNLRHKDRPILLSRVAALNIA